MSQLFNPDKETNSTTLITERRTISDGIAIRYQGRCKSCGYRSDLIPDMWTVNNAAYCQSTVESQVECVIEKASNITTDDSATERKMGNNPVQVDRKTILLEYACFVCSECGALTSRQRMIRYWPLRAIGIAFFLGLSLLVASASCMYVIAIIGGFTLMFFFMGIYVAVARMFSAWSKPSNCELCGGGLRPMWAQRGILYLCPSCATRSYSYEEVFDTCANPPSVTMGETTAPREIS